MPGRILPDLTADPTRYMPSAPQARRGPKPRVTVDQVKEACGRGLTNEEMIAELGCSLQTLMKRKHAAGLVRPYGKRSAGARSRHSSKQAGKPAVMPSIDTPALTEARTMYPSTVVPVDGLLNALVKGENSWKIGERIIKGSWKGFPIYTLTLEERATCPTYCAHWRSCFGNHMRFAKRIVHGPAFEDRVEHELAVLQSRHPDGFAVRLHVLGDFYSVDYVERWRGFLDRFPALHVFGFTARWDAARDPIARALVHLVLERWDRFAVRFSNAPVEECSTVSIEHPVQKPADAIICPQQTGRTASCGTCGLCWATMRRIAFLRH
jgi:hypothetical protein